MAVPERPTDDAVAVTLYEPFGSLPFNRTVIFASPLLFVVAVEVEILPSGLRTENETGRPDTGVEPAFTVAEI